MKLQKRIDIPAALIAFFGIVTWMATMAKSGICFNLGCDSGRSFWGPNGHDGIWHIAVSESLVKGSFENPVFSGESLKNYHFGYDLILSFVHKLTGLPTVNLYFQILPLLFSILLGIYVYKLVKLLAKSEISARISLFFVYFGGSFGYLVSLVKTANFGGESAFWAQQSISTQVNPPFALSLLIFVAGLYYLKLGLEKNSNSFLIASVYLFSSLVQIKIYAGLLAVAALFVTSVIEIIRRRGLTLFKVFVSALLLSVIMFPKTDNNVGVSFAPFWFLESMMYLTDRVGWLRFGEAMVNYKLGGEYLKYLITVLVSFIIFIVGNFGTRAIILSLGFKKIITKVKELDAIEIIFISVILMGVSVPLFFVQKATPWNTIQFMYYSLMFAGILGGIYAERTFKSGRLGKITVLTLVFLTFPTTISTLSDVYLPARPPSYISQAEIQALHFLKDQPDGVVLTYPFDKDLSKLAESNPPRPLYLYESTAYVSAFSKKKVFLEDEVNLEITGYNWKKRRKEIDDWYKQTDFRVARDFLKSNNISYIYWIKSDVFPWQRAVLGETQLGLTLIFDNKEVQIYRTEGS